MTNTNKFEELLKKELGIVERELQKIGRKNPSNKSDWEAMPEKMDISEADENEKADSIEAFEENSAILKQLEIRFNEVKDALKKIQDGKYGICEIGGEEIEEKRLEANPAAKTCVKHMSK
jgi:RNA polymerase-binding transcription factor DksA